MPIFPLLMAAAIFGKAAPDGNARRWFTTADYPLDALLEHEQGVVGFEIAVDRDGRPTGCRVYRGSGHARLDKATCTLAMERARFKPLRKIARAKGRKGGMIASGPTLPSVYRHAVRWRLPNLGGTTDQTFVVRSMITPSGVVESCIITGVGGLNSGTSCGLFGDRAFLAGMLGANYAKTARAEVRLDLTYAAAQIDREMRGPDAYQLMAEAAVTFAADGRLQGCTGIKPLRSPAKTTDLCTVIRAQPPKVAAGAAGRQGIYTLDLSAYFR